MKTLSRITLALLMAILFSNSILADGFKLNEEKYINDIPFNTNKIASQSLYLHAVNQQFEMEEEVIDDIPFDTYEIAKQEILRLSLAKEFSLEDEEYINDIPFDTEEIANINCNGNMLVENLRSAD
jgi:hypothetical protein